MPTPKRHHYVPRFYLKGFAARDGALFAHDLDTGAIRKGTTLTEGVERHFYRVSGSDVARVEKGLSEIEGHAASIIREIERSRDLPCNKRDFEGLLFFVALQSQRVVRAADDIERWLIDEARRLRGELSAAEEERFRLAHEDMAKDGYEPSEPKTLDELGASIVDGRITIDRDHVVAHMMGTAKSVFEVFMKRIWTLAVLAEGSPDLITSDSPVNAVRTGDFGTSALNAGYHFPDRIVLYPMTRRFGLVGNADGRKRLRAAPADEQQSALLNWSVLMGARRYAWSRRPRIHHVAGEGIHNETSHVVSLRRKWRERRSLSG